METVFRAVSVAEIRKDYRALLAELEDRRLADLTFGELRFLQEQPSADQSELSPLYDFYTAERLAKLRAIVARTRPEGGKKI